MGDVNFRDAYEFDPETYGGEGGGLAGMVQRYLQQPSQQKEGVDFGSPANGAPDYSPEMPFSPQFGLLGRLLSLYAEQSGYQPFTEDNAQPWSASPDPNFRKLARIPNAAQAEQGRVPAEIAPLDPIDIAKSAGIGLVKGGVNAVGLLGDILTGFGHFPNNFVANQSRRIAGLPLLPADESDHFKPWTSDQIRRSMEEYTGELYQPKSRAGRYAETIGEMAPMVVGGEGLGIARGAQATGAALRELPGVLARHAVAPGIAVQALEETLPDSEAGETRQKVYPVVRRGLPLVLAAKRYLGRRSVQQ